MNIPQAPAARVQLGVPQPVDRASLFWSTEANDASSGRELSEDDSQSSDLIIYGDEPLVPRKSLRGRVVSGQQSLAEMAIPGLGGPTADGRRSSSQTTLQSDGNQALLDDLLANDDLLMEAGNPSGRSNASPGDSLLNAAESALPTYTSAPTPNAIPPQSALGSNGSLPDATNAAVNSRYQQALDALPAPIGSPGVPQDNTNQPAWQRSGGSVLDALPSSLFEGGAGTTRVPEELQVPNPMGGAPARPQFNPQVNPHVNLFSVPPSSGDAGSALDRRSNGNTSNPKDSSEKTLEAPKYDGPFFLDAYGETQGPHVDVLAKQVPYQADAFLPSPMSPIPNSFEQESSIYRGKFPVPTQRPIVELWRPLYTGGTYPTALDWFGQYNLVMPHFLVYGDFRTAGGFNRNATGDAHNLVVAANLDMDLEITATERIHAFITPFDRAGDFTRLDFTNRTEFVDRTDLRMDTLFFEGDAGAIWGGLTDQNDPFDLPFTLGFFPVFYQNGIWANDNVIGAAFALPAKHNKLLKWSNFDATFFWAADQINTDAFPGDNTAAEFFGTAWFIEAYDGYIEADYAFVHDDAGEHRSYHNFSVAYSRRYFHKVSNSVRFITNFDQSLPRDQRTAQGHLLLIENSLISKTPNTLVPYLNFFYGQGRTQSLARAGVAGGILNNTGINFETDGLTGYPTLDATGVNTTGAAMGVNMLGQNFDQQLILEVAALTANGDAQFRNAPGDQCAVGMRYQRPLSNAWIFRTDHMVGFRRNADDLRGSRVELRWKF